MDFTSLQQLSYPEELFPKTSEKAKIQPPLSSPFEDFAQVLEQISRINFQKSSMVSESMDTLGDMPPSLHEMLGLPKPSNRQQDAESDGQVAKSNSTDFPPIPSTFRKSSIFGDTKHLSIKNQSLQKIHIFYFGAPISKQIRYDQHTTMRDLIVKALSAFLKDETLEESMLVSFEPEDYELRFSDKDENYFPDMSLESLESDRLVMDGFFQMFVLMIKGNRQTRERKISYNKHRESIQEALNDQAQGIVKIRLFNEINNQIGVLDLKVDDTLQKVFDYVQCKEIYYHKYFIAENLHDDFELPRDFEVKNLSSYKLYVKNKRYADQSEDTVIKPFTIERTRNRGDSKILLPINITEASMYEQFPVIKINWRGTEQKRILGIDQMKIYNYEPEMRKQKKQVSFLSSILGTHKQTGTQKPFRLIKEIKQIEQTKKGINIHYQDKTNVYVVQNLHERARLLRKLRFLAGYHQDLPISQFDD